MERGARCLIPTESTDAAERTRYRTSPEFAPEPSSRHFEGKLELLDRIGMPLAPKVDQDLRQPPAQDPGPVHPGVAPGAERHQPGVVAGLAVMNV